MVSFPTGPFRPALNVVEPRSESCPVRWAKRSDHLYVLTIDLNGPLLCQLLSELRSDDLPVALDDGRVRTDDWPENDVKDDSADPLSGDRLEEVDRHHGRLPVPVEGVSLIVTTGAEVDDGRPLGDMIDRSPFQVSDQRNEAMLNLATAQRDDIGLAEAEVDIARWPGQLEPALDITPRAQAAVATSSLNFSDGVIQPSVSRGRSLSSSAMASSW